jgi:hypothetical protein
VYLIRNCPICVSIRVPVELPAEDYKYIFDNVLRYSLTVPTADVETTRSSNAGGYIYTFCISADALPEGTTVADFAARIRPMLSNDAILSSDEGDHAILSSCISLIVPFLLSLLMFLM